MTASKMQQQLDALTATVSQLAEIVTASVTEANPQKTKAPKRPKVAAPWKLEVTKWKSNVTGGGRVKMDSTTLADGTQILVYVDPKRVRKSMTITVEATGEGL